MNVTLGSKFRGYNFPKLNTLFLLPTTYELQLFHSELWDLK